MIMERSTVLEKTTTVSTSTVVDDSTEISIFDAQKYFNELNLLEAQKSGTTNINDRNRVSTVHNVVVMEPPRFSSASSSIDSYPNSMYRNYMRTRSFRSAATPTASSEASWNSQTGLLSVPQGSMAVSLRNPLSSTDMDDKKVRMTTSTTTTTPFSWLCLRRKCPCSCKKSVQVKDKSLRARPESSHLPVPQIVLPPQTPSSVDRLLHSHILRGGTTTGTTSKSSMAEIRSSIITSSNFQENWDTQGPRSRNSRDTTRSFSSTSAMEVNHDDPLKLQVLHGISPIKTVAGRSCGGSATAAATTSNTGFTFPILNVNPGSSSSLSSPPKIKMSLIKNQASMGISTNSIAEDPSRESLEIFRPPSHDQQSSTMLVSSSGKNSEHFMRSSDNRTPPPHQTFTFPASPTSRMRNNNNHISVNNADVDDVASDASSDLFEIESFSTQTTTTTATTTTAAHPSMFPYHCQRRDTMEEAAVAASSFQSTRRISTNAAFMAGSYNHHNHRRTSLDEPVMMAATAECYAYEPSEASIDWSVTTAEGFDRASVANASEADYGEFYVRKPDPPVPGPEKSKKRSSGNGLLMSCRCEKAVSVGPGPRPVSRPMGLASGTSSAGAGDHGRQVGPGISLSSNSTLAMWAVGHKL